jgi:Cu(I)/Ag(I) efflux system membrane fusion protein
VLFSFHLTLYGEAYPGTLIIMKNTKHVLILIIGCLFFGGVIGWSLRSGGEAEGLLTHAHPEGTEFTCSMHPQIRQATPGSCPICGMALTPVQSNHEDADSPYQLKMTPSAVALANIATTKVSSGTHSPRLTLNGKVQPDETRISSISANFSGRVEQLFVSFTGQTVEKGDKLATIYAPELVSAQRELIEAKRIKTESPSLYHAARNKLAQWRLTPAQIDRLEASNEVQHSFDIIADRSGVVTERKVSVGDFVSKGSVLFDIIDLQRVWVYLDVYENDLSQVQVGDKVSFTANAYPGQSFDGRVMFVDPLLDAQTRTLKVRVEADNLSLLLKPEMFVTALLEAGNKTNEESLVIPQSAILWTGKKSIVYVQVGSRENPAFEMREVELGASLGEAVAVKTGLRLGEEVVSNGAFAVDGAAQLSGNYSMMNRPQSLEVTAGFQKGFDQILTFYFDLKNSLVNSNAQAAALSAASMQKAYDEIDEEELESSDRKLWEELSHSLSHQAHLIAETTDIKQQRGFFQALSDQMILIVERVGTGDPVYKQYCPMADQDRGAYWLSKEKEVRNPYFGEVMLKCGEVQESYQKKL